MTSKLLGQAIGLSGTAGNYFYDNGATAGNYGSMAYNWFCGQLLS